jgi:hypothetical protein
LDKRPMFHRCLGKQDRSAALLEAAFEDISGSPL